MSDESRKLLIEAMQKAKKKRQERVASRKKAESDISAASIKTGELMGQMSGLPQDRKTISGYDPKTKLSDVPALNKDNKDATLKGIMQEIGIDEEWAATQLTENPKAWFSHLSGEPIEDRLTQLRDEEKRKGSTHPNAVAIANMTDDEISAYARRIEDNIPSEEKTAYNDSKRGYRHREVQRFDDKLREQKENEILDADKQDLEDAQNTQKRSLRTLSPEVSIMNAMSQLPGGTIEGAVEQGISPAIRALKSLANGGKIPRYNKKRTIKYRK
jgi:hypothetical protein